MGFSIALAGKGGTGKTSIAGLLIRYLIEKRKGPILAVDADANANLNDVLGVAVTDTVGHIREEASETAGGRPAAGIPGAGVDGRRGAERPAGRDRRLQGLDHRAWPDRDDLQGTARPG